MSKPAKKHKKSKVLKGAWEKLYDAIDELHDEIREKMREKNAVVVR